MGHNGQMVGKSHKFVARSPLKHPWRDNKEGSIVAQKIRIVDKGYVSRIEKMLP